MWSEYHCSYQKKEACLVIDNPLFEPMTKNANSCLAFGLASVLKVVQKTTFFKLYKKHIDSWNTHGFQSRITIVLIAEY